MGIEHILEIASKILGAIHTFVHTPYGTGAISGLTVAIAGDYHAFQSWKSWDDAVKYSWSTATFRWVQGVIIGAVGTTGISALL